MENKLKLFQGKSIRSAWNEEEQQWYFSILDVVQVLTDNAMLSNIQSECVQEMVFVFITIEQPKLIRNIRV